MLYKKLNIEEMYASSLQALQSLLIPVSNLHISFKVSGNEEDKQREKGKLISQ
jgi:hypothetical protein